MLYGGYVRYNSNSWYCASLPWLKQLATIRRSIRQPWI